MYSVFTVCMALARKLASSRFLIIIFLGIFIYSLFLFFFFPIHFNIITDPGLADISSMGYATILYHNVYERQAGSQEKSASAKRKMQQRTSAMKCNAKPGTAQHSKADSTHIWMGFWIQKIKTVSAAREHQIKEMKNEEYICFCMKFK